MGIVFSIDICSPVVCSSLSRVLLVRYKLYSDATWMVLHLAPYVCIVDWRRVTCSFGPPRVRNSCTFYVCFIEPLVNLFQLISQDISGRSLWQWNSLRAHHLHEFNSCKRFLEWCVVVQAFMERRKKLNIIRVVLEPSVASILSCVVRSLLRFLSSLLPRASEPSLEQSLHRTDRVCVYSSVCGSSWQRFSWFLLAFHERAAS